METRITYLLIRLFPFGLTFEDLRHLCLEYYGKTELVIFMLFLIGIIIIELLNFFPNVLLNVISLKQRRLIQLAIHLGLVGHTIVLCFIHSKGWPTIIFTTLVCGFYFFIVHKWVHKLQEEKIQIKSEL
jgi:hypothetical protein